MIIEELPYGNLVKPGLLDLVFGGRENPHFRNPPIAHPFHHLREGSPVKLRFPDSQHVDCRGGNERDRLQIICVCLRSGTGRRRHCGDF